MPIVRRLYVDDWALYRDTRLAALRDAPDAFGSTFAREAAFADDEWRDRLAAAAVSGRDLPLVAEEGGSAVGLAWVRVGVDESDVANLYQVWVHPTMRRHGIGQMLIEHAAIWAASVGACRLALTVALGPDSALEFYRSVGFTEVGVRSWLRQDADLWQQPMERPLR